MPGRHDPRLVRFARHMRREPTDAERRLWWIVRDRRLDGYKFRRQYPIGPYIADCYCAEAKLIVELDGGQHAEPEAVEYDARRTRYLASAGMLVMRFWDHQVLKEPEAVARTILRELRQRCPREE